MIFPAVAALTGVVLKIIHENKNTTSNNKRVNSAILTRDLTCIFIFTSFFEESSSNRTGENG